jgi:hypothetical protein
VVADYNTKVAAYAAAFTDYSAAVKSFNLSHAPAATKLASPTTYDAD